MPRDFRTVSAVASKLALALFSLTVVALISINSVKSAAAASPEFTPRDLAAALPRGSQRVAARLPVGW